jgi:hypothetical protein
MVNPRFPRKCKAARPPSPSSDIGAPPSKKQRKEPAKKPKEKKEPAKKKKEQAKGSSVSASAAAAAAVQSPRAAASDDADDADDADQDNKVPDKGPGLMFHRNPTGDDGGFNGMQCWDDLRHLVHSFVEKQVVGTVQWATVDAGTKERLTSWAPKAEQYLSQPRNSRRTQAPPPGLC